MTGSAIASVVVAVALAAAPMLPGSHSGASAQPNSHGFAEPGQRHDPSQPTAGEKVIVKAGLFDWLFGGSAREQRPERGPRFEQAPPPTRDDRPDRDENYERRGHNDGGTFKTLCVRLCDGFYFPISAATRRDSFAGDAKRCEQSCPSGSRMFVFRNPGEGVENMVDLQGHRYRDLPTAFQHLNRYDASCTCRGNPWDEAALARHRAYAQEAERKGADQQIVQRPPEAQPPRRAARQSHWGYQDRRPRREWD